MAPRHMRALAQFRTGVAPIRIETGRYERGRLPVERRVCFKCQNKVEDELHVITACPLYANLRHQLYNSALQINTDFNLLNDRDKLNFILSCPDITKLVARILYEILQTRAASFY